MAKSKSEVIEDLPLPPARRGPLPTRDLSAYLQLDVLCINCQEMVNVDFIEQHSRVCTRLSEEVQLAEQSQNPLSALDLRMKKLTMFLQQLTLDTNRLRSGERNYLTIMVRLLQQLNSTNTLESSEDVLKSLSSLVATFKGTDAMLLYLERVRSLALEQEAILRETELKKKREEVEVLKEEVEVQKRKVQVWQRTLQKARASEPAKIDDIHSEVASVKSGSSDASMSLIQDDMKAEYLIEEEPKLDRSPPDVEELKRVFFSQCLAIKLGFKPKDPAQAVPISALYRKAVDAKISVENWPEFIHKELSQPEQWTAKAKPSRRFAPRPINTKFAYFETIKEEEAEGQTDH